VAIVGSILTLALGGTVRPETVAVVHSSNYVPPIYGESNSRTSVGYSENFSRWLAHKGPTVQGEHYSTESQLVASGEFGNAPTAASFVMTKQVSINIPSYPILEVHLNVTSKVGYGLRFYANNSDGTRFNVWWEGSDLDHRPGKGFEVIRANMERQAILATGRQVGSLSGLEIYLEVPPDTATDFRLALSKFEFKNEVVMPLQEGEEYRALYIDVMRAPSTNSSWSLNRINLGVTLTARPGSHYAIYFVDEPLIYSSLIIREIAYSELEPYYQLAFYPTRAEQIFPELLPKTNTSIVLVVKSGAFQSIQLDYLDFILLPAKESASNPSLQPLALYYTYFMFFLFLLPIGLAVSIFVEFFHHQSIRRRNIALVLGTGLLSRLALAATTAHLFDTNIVIASTRSWFQYGTPSGSLGPTLPLTYFLYWVAYSPYALLQMIGYQDVAFLDHQAGMTESVFIKLFPIAMDSLIFLTLLKFSNSGKAFVWAAFYFLNPLSIFVSSVWGEYEAGTVAFIVLGTYWVTRDKVARAGLAFMASGMLQLLGLIPYVILLLKTGRLGRFRSLLAVALTPLLLLPYPPQADLMFRISLGLSGLVRGQFSTAGVYSLLGNIPQLDFVLAFHPLLIAGIGIALPASFDIYKRRINAKRIALYTAACSIAFLLLSNLLAAWVWVLGIGLLYAIVKNKDDLGAFMLVFGAAMAFLIISLHAPSGWAYYFFGPVDLPFQPTIETVRNRLVIFSVIATTLGLMSLAYLRYGHGKAGSTLIRASGIVLSLHLLLYFWLGAYPL